MKCEAHTIGSFEYSLQHVLMALNQVAEVHCIVLAAAFCTVYCTVTNLALRLQHSNKVYLLAYLLKNVML